MRYNFNVVKLFISILLCLLIVFGIGLATFSKMSRQTDLIHVTFYPFYTPKGSHRHRSGITPISVESGGYYQTHVNVDILFCLVLLFLLNKNK